MTVPEVFAIASLKTSKRLQTNFLKSCNLFKDLTSNMGSVTKSYDPVTRNVTYNEVYSLEYENDKNVNMR